MSNQDIKSVKVGIMKQIVENVISDIIASRVRARHPMQYALSIEVAHATGLSVAQVESVAREIKGIVIGRTLRSCLKFIEK